ncbi:hypothetical protein HDU81_010860 [Chytriomyces hyalinus]|nr:hypothetical protein HDU81_010860 [Chytriomyces hyalinus]
MRTGYATFDHGNLIRHDEGPSCQQVTFVRKSVSQLPLPPIQSLLEMQETNRKREASRSKSQLQKYPPLDLLAPPPRPDTAAMMNASLREDEPVNRNISHHQPMGGMSFDSAVVAQLGMMETRGLSEKVAGIERFVAGELERVRDSIRHFEAMVKEESLRRELSVLLTNIFC